MGPLNVVLASANTIYRNERPMTPARRILYRLSSISSLMETRGYGTDGGRGEMQSQYEHTLTLHHPLSTRVSLGARTPSCDAERGFN